VGPPGTGKTSVLAHICVTMVDMRWNVSEDLQNFETLSREVVMEDEFKTIWDYDKKK
jgi:Ni2+-binding GTPase involved in maturation of urease and hydrogenase